MQYIEPVTEVTGKVSTNTNVFSTYKIHKDNCLKMQTLVKIRNPNFSSRFSGP